MSDIILLLIILGVTFITGSIIEKRHFENIRKREIALIRKPIVNLWSKSWHTYKKIK